MYHLKGYTALPFDAPLETPWRMNPDWNSNFMEELKERVMKYQPIRDIKVPQTRILLIGEVGAGKSSFINTVFSIFKGRISSPACAGSGPTPITTAYRMYQIRNGASDVLNFRLHDTRGIDGGLGLEPSEIGYLLDGHLPDCYQFNSSLPISPDTPGFVKNPNMCDKIHCVVIVMHGSPAHIMPEYVAKRIQDMQTQICLRDIPQVVLLTNIDKICEITAENVSQVFYSPMIHDTVDRVSEMMEIPRSHILPVKNYNSEMELNDNINILTLMNLAQMLNFADDYMLNCLELTELQE